MSAHTPGPWEIDDTCRIVAPAFVGRVRREGGAPETGLVALVYAPVDDIAEWSATHDANHRLIAAAPDLLAIAKRVYKEIRDYHKGFDAFLWVELEDVIAKAEGRAEGV
jgi:hypothetical protein